MRRKNLVVLTLLLVASMMAAMGTGAMNSFVANRAAAMEVVTDADGLLGIVGDGKYAIPVTSGQNRGALGLDFTDSNGNFAGDGFNPQAKMLFNDVFTITNNSPDKLFVWLEANGWDSHHNSGLRYSIDELSEGANYVKDLTANPDKYGHKLLLWSTGDNFKEGIGRLAFVELDPGENFTVKIDVNTVMANGYGSPGKDWGHTVIVKASQESPLRPGQQ